ncbi:trans-aconitate 2-methyltransferase [Ferruginibacter sp. HRS2-29]|uniref:class I SAM-dependent methyltransferase n=1 Tax=Ferruginibacter sp. HRS2-29 TaxID=2487334 RepID=UPI0020CCC775|nr:class I SAM-dependent methyltransferase [Ferruginibacter sp. HRS2-29]MCP9752408.1 class I SAM-dependent methyltransferase [Ferruginibacter sp. HRS2-29]
MDKYKETFETWDKLAGLYQEKFMHLDLYDDTYDLFCNELEPHAALLEIGCGPGNIAAYLLKKMPELKIDANDISPNMIGLAQLNNPSAHCYVMDSRDISQIEKKFDGIVAGFCIPYLSVPDTRQLVKDCNNLLNENGVLYISFVEGNPGDSGYKAGSTGDRTYFYYHEWKVLEEMMKKDNFEILHLIHKSYKRNDGSEELHSIAIAKKPKHSD